MSSTVVELCASSNARSMIPGWFMLFPEVSPTPIRAQSEQRRPLRSSIPDTRPWPRRLWQGPSEFRQGSAVLPVERLSALALNANGNSQYLRRPIGDSLGFSGSAKNLSGAAVLGPGTAISDVYSYFAVNVSPRALRPLLDRRQA